MVRLPFYSSILCGLVLAGCAPEQNFIPRDNLAPTAAITAPIGGAVFTDSELFDLTGTVADADGIDDIQSVVWRSDLDGELATLVPDENGTIRTAVTLTAGLHSLQLRATDTEGAEGVATVSIQIVGQTQQPVGLITSPFDNGTYISSEIVDLIAEISDIQQQPETLQVVWAYEPTTGGARVVIDGSAEANTSGDVATIWEDLEPGTWRVLLEVTDDDGNIGEDSVAIIVVDPDDADPDGDGAIGLVDCDDTNDEIYPNQDESCNGVDDDCSGTIDDKDLDLDGHIDEDCVLYPGAAPVDDCNDNQRFVFSGALEVADGADNNCDGRIDEGTALHDDDGDCFCESVQFCNGSIEPSCFVLGFDDCDDADFAMNPSDVDLDSASTCDGDCDDNNAAANLNDFDGDGYNTCNGECNDFLFDTTPPTCAIPPAP
ncbi:MAG: hypothetical protein GWP91_20690 [Rhodobacterales bacterium]|nr:hypothetical protein [Rhodobacterales bacterium]